MNRIVRIAVATLSIAAAGSALAESPFFTLEPAAAAVTAAVRPTPIERSVVRGVLHDYIEVRAAATPTSRSRAEVRAEAQAALRSGELRQPPVAEDAFYPLHASVASVVKSGELLARAGR